MKQLKMNRLVGEVIVCVIILVLGASVFFINKKSQGTLTYDKGNIKYHGQIVNHRMNGQGRLTYKNGDVYEGHFVNGVFDGKGKFVAKTGWSYEGSFKNGQADGQGTLIAKDKKVYKGTFKQGIYQK